MDFTTEQFAAISTLDTNLVVTAGAGSGKTRVLTERFIQVLQAHPTWHLSSVVAITFTEKAAREMRDRIRQAVRHQISIATAARDTGAAALWRRHEAALDGARIQTIHALCASILRSNPVEAWLDPGFEVADEIDSAVLLDEAIDAALAQLVETGAPAMELLRHYTVRDVRLALRDYAGHLPAQAFVASLEGMDSDALMARWQTQWAQASREVLDQLHKDQYFWNDLTWPDTLDPVLDPSGDRLWAYWEHIESYRDLLLDDDPGVVVDELTYLATEVKVNAGSRTYWGDAETLAMAKEMLKRIRETARAYLDMLLPQPGEHDRLAAQILFSWRDAIQLVATEFQRLKTSRNVLDYDDLEALALELLETHPAVAARYAGNEFQHVMVDEFQDTNDAQRRIIYALCGIDPARRQAEPGRLFVVGDPKQSIYAFRGADVSVFDNVRHEIESLGGQRLQLSRSFRSHARLIGLFNDLFAQLLTRPAGPVQDYFVEHEPMEAHRPARAEHALPISVLLVKTPEDETHKLHTEDKRRWEAFRLGHHLQEMVSQGTVIWDKSQGNYRELQFGDIAVLFQSMSSTPLYEEIFQDLGIPYVTVAGKGYYDRQEVWDLMNLLAALHQPTDDLALASVLRSPMFGLSDEALLALRLRRDGERVPYSLWQMIEWETNGADLPPEWPLLPDEDRAALVYAHRVLSDLHRLAGRLTIAELLEIAREMTGYEAILTALPSGNRRRANVDKLVAMARQSGRISLSEFNRYLRDMGSLEAREGEAALEAEGAITLMTVHKSKGLEFPVVVLADASWSFIPRNPLVTNDVLAGPACCIYEAEALAEAQPFAYTRAKQFRQERAAAERKRLLYVAATRAQDYLVISGFEKTGSNWLSQLLSVWGIDTNDLPTQAQRTVIDYSWGKLALEVTVAAEYSPDHTSRPAPLAVGQESAPPDSATDTLPPELHLLDTVPPSKRDGKWHIRATDLERLGRIPFEQPEERARADFRWMLLRDLPGPVRPVVSAQAGPARVSKVIGQMVHRALQIELLPGRRQLAEVQRGLEIYAWEMGLTDREQQREAVERAQHLLQSFVDSQAAKMLQRADTLQREVSFVYEQGRFVIHGIIDTLFYLDGRWHVLDYKTGQVSGKLPLRTFSTRYLFQMGAYARALEAQTGETPRVWLFYLQGSAGQQLYEIPEQDWRPAIDHLGEEIATTLADNTQWPFAQPLHPRSD
ncbi:MAG: UvrD-helicase domain-containing protein [Chloroflexi bacterium]|nr:UvrD-helicase domain-containing protein [Chloroflexota bacterium]